MNQYKVEFPFELFIPIQDQEEYLARVVIMCNQEMTKFNADLDVVYSESKKIFKHIGRLYDLPSFNDARDNAVSTLAKALAE